MHATKIGKLISWLAVSTAVLVNILGYYSDLYARWWWFDRVLHAFTLFAVTLWLGLVVCAVVFRSEHSRGLRIFLLLVSVGIAVGALWEVAEWAFNSFTSADVIKGKDDTVLDIIMDTAGALAAALLAMSLLIRPVRE